MRVTAETEHKNAFKRTDENPKNLYSRCEIRVLGSIVKLSKWAYPVQNRVNMFHGFFFCGLAG